MGLPLPLPYVVQSLPLHARRSPFDVHSQLFCGVVCDGEQVNSFEQFLINFANETVRMSLFPHGTIAWIFLTLEAHDHASYVCLPATCVMSQLQRSCVFRCVSQLNVRPLFVVGVHSKRSPSFMAVSPLNLRPLSLRFGC